MQLDDDARSSRWTALALFLYATGCAAVLAFVVYRSQGIVEAKIDLNGFGLLSRNIAEGRGFSLGQGPTVRRAPLLPLIGALLLKVFGSDRPGIPEALIYRPIIVAQCVFFGLTCLTVWALARRMFGPRVALIAGLLTPLVPQSMRYVGMTEVEPLMGLIVCLLAYTGLNVLERPGTGTGIAFGLTAAAGTLAKPIVLFYPFFFLVLAWWSWTRSPAPSAPAGSRARVAASAAIAASFIAALIPWTVRNLAVTSGKFIGISSNGPGEFLRGYVNAQPKYYLLRQDFGGTDPGPEKWDPEANVYEDGILRQYGSRFPSYPNRSETAETAGDGVSSALIEAEKDRLEMIEMKRRIFHAPLDFLRKFAIQLVTFWYVVETRTKSVLVGAMALVALVLAGIGVARARREGRSSLPVISVLVYFNIMYAVFLAFARYSMPLYPALTVLAAGGLVSVLSPQPRLAPASRAVGQEAVK